MRRLCHPLTGFYPISVLYKVHPYRDEPPHVLGLRIVTVVKVNNAMVG